MVTQSNKASRLQPDRNLGIGGTKTHLRGDKR